MQDSSSHFLRNARFDTTEEVSLRAVIVSVSQNPVKIRSELWETLVCIRIFALPPLFDMVYSTIPISSA